MEEIILQILDALRRGETVDDRALVKLVHAQARRAGGDKRAFAKRRLLPFYQRVKREEPERWARWGITPELEEGLIKVLRMKPRRSASGVATITVITKPWPCSGSCIFCPSDVRMPKSYLADEPACARAEQACPKSYLVNEPACERAVQSLFDPYLQVSARLTALSQMGHATDKIELIVLGGTWSDYPVEYQIWFMRELFRALNDDATVDESGSSARVGSGDDSGIAFAPPGSSATRPLPSSTAQALPGRRPPAYSARLWMSSNVSSAATRPRATVWWASSSRPGRTPSRPRHS